MVTESPAPCRVLLVDDDEAFRIAMSKALRRRGFEVTPIADGAGAVAAFRDTGGERGEKHDVAVLDLRMSDMNGLEVLRRTAARTIPVVVLTGHGSVPDAVEAMRLGAHTFLMKPLDAEALAPIIQSAAALAATPIGPPDGLLVGEAPATRAFRAVLDRLSQAACAVFGRDLQVI